MHILHSTFICTILELEVSFLSAKFPPSNISPILTYFVLCNKSVFPNLFDYENPFLTS